MVRRNRSRGTTKSSLSNNSPSLASSAKYSIQNRVAFGRYDSKAYIPLQAHIDNNQRLKRAPHLLQVLDGG